MKRMVTDLLAKISTAIPQIMTFTKATIKGMEFFHFQRKHKRLKRHIASHMFSWRNYYLRAFAVTFRQASEHFGK